ncbi:MAG: hypothetical protein HOM68_01970 [Gemmatimonadetes bacterium]|jgi:ectoine hydroxylase-related dioxygenase (phytanoyl-CoA dioxygenase family)|nr:hypothetical protein [Gemmatimonadota bacterium]MBT4609576.1 hypothetical protein [Gemmatimonadota bacterium]MBT5055281.1 hypothetical protein [Gemmatimonadota bacterium]MBT5142849.1 hypothetical protein [Gemmatimonadota bacterium]MBT5589442.1 hypothetical protein [Gemmatimonadota bacterium]
MERLTTQQRQQFDDEGYVVVDNLLSPTEVDVLRHALAELEDSNRQDECFDWQGGHIVTIHGLPLLQGALSRLAQYRPVVDLISELMGRSIQLTGAILLDKHPQHNWDIGWHQDNGIYVDHIPDGAPEDIRGGIPVYSTLAMEMAQNVSCRISLDEAGFDTGGLYVLPRSHLENYGGNDKIEERFGDHVGVLAHQEPGSALCYRPLLLHRANKMTATGRRRILHLQYGPDDLKLPGTDTYPWPQGRPLTALESLLAE